MRYDEVLSKNRGGFLAFLRWLCAIVDGGVFLVVGEGIPFPWDPPQKLVVRGPCCHLRNPLIVGVILMLLAESLLFCSWSISI